MKDALCVKWIPISEDSELVDHWIDIESVAKYQILAGASTNQDGQVSQSSSRKAPGLGHCEARSVLGERLRRQKWVVAINQKLGTFQYF